MLYNKSQKTKQVFKAQIQPRINIKNYYNIQDKPMEIIPFENQLLKKNHKVCLIGNGKSIYEQKYGSEINKFDVVIRFNVPDFTKNKDYIGTKTDILISYYNFHFVPNYAIKQNLSISDIEKQYESINNVKVILQASANDDINKTKEFYESVNSKAPVFVNLYKNNRFIMWKMKKGTLFFSDLYQLIKKYKLPFPNVAPRNLSGWCTSGLIGILWVIIHGIKPHIYGFDYNDETEYYHVYSKGNLSYSVNHTNHHDIAFERKYIKQLLNEKFIVSCNNFDKICA